MHYCIFHVPRLIRGELHLHAKKPPSLISSLLGRLCAADKTSPTGGGQGHQQPPATTTGPSPAPGRAFSPLPRQHARQLPLHKLLHALMLGRLRQEDAEGQEVPAGVSHQAPHG